jgi:hypothetical protein
LSFDVLKNALEKQAKLGIAPWASANPLRQTRTKKLISMLRSIPIEIEQTLHSVVEAKSCVVGKSLRAVVIRTL